MKVQIVYTPTRIDSNPKVRIASALALEQFLLALPFGNNLGS